MPKWWQRFFLPNNCKNETTCIGDVHDLQGGHFVFGPPFCKICNSAPSSVNMCAVRMYYVVHKQLTLTWTTIHLGTHDHPMAKGHFRLAFD